MIQELKYLLIAGGAPCLGFTLGILLSFAIFPYDAEGASKTIMTLSGTGALVGIFLVVHRIRQILKHWKK